MKKIPFAQAEFIMTALKEESLPSFKTVQGTPMPEMAIVGRSNVGKSSLINHLLKRNSLAKASSTPGKTKAIHFFTVDNALAIADLPGYGYAKVMRSLKTIWADEIDSYLNKREPLKLILFLLDARRLPAEEDCTFIHWAIKNEKRLLLVFTKSDKIQGSERRIHTEQVLKLVKPHFLNTPIHYIHYSNRDQKARQELIHTINTLLIETHGTPK